MSDDRDRARSLVEALMAEDAARTKRRFRDVEAEDGVCWREYGLHPGFAKGDGWALFYLLAVGECRGCEGCVEAAWERAFKCDD